MPHSAKPGAAWEKAVLKKKQGLGEQSLLPRTLVCREWTWAGVQGREEPEDLPGPAPL